ncbi:exodeoxyribonuclease VII large subunit, partial [Puniceibacterium confluentis]|uniref:exodeoxyribonuclease VII large subunit n=1 Tax=Puniceibacterium confluentis TaxID=1958944 RepID=UPI00356199CE
GGGSIEDLWGFNEEIVARAAAASDIPLISAVGHETDTTLIDHVSDRRAPTPTAAAELAVPVRLELLAWVGDMQARLGRALGQRLEVRGQRLRDLARALPRAETLLDQPRQRLDSAGTGLGQALIRSVQIRRVRLSQTAGSLRPATLAMRIGQGRGRLEDRGERLAPGLTRLIAARREALGRRADRLSLRPIVRDLQARRDRLDTVGKRFDEAAQGQMDDLRRRLETLDRLRETLSYKATLERGYAVVRGDGAVVTGKAAAAAASGLEIEFADGRFRIGGSAPRKAARKPPEQGTLI